MATARGQEEWFGRCSLMAALCTVYKMKVRVGVCHGAGSRPSHQPADRCRLAIPVSGEILHTFVLLVLLVFLASDCFAEDGYHHTGKSYTAVVPEAGAVMALHGPGLEKEGGYRHTLVWQILWDIQASGQYVEAGVGYRSGARKVQLWWATARKRYGAVVGYIEPGTAVAVHIRKAWSDALAHVTWTWFDGAQWQTVEKWVAVAGWVNVGGIHPAKVEIYTDGSHQEVIACVADAWPADGHLKAHPEYPATPDSTAENFCVVR